MNDVDLYFPFGQKATRSNSEYYDPFLEYIDISVLYNCMMTNDDTGETQTEMTVHGFFHSCFFNLLNVPTRKALNLSMFLGNNHTHKVNSRSYSTLG